MPFTKYTPAQSLLRIGDLSLNVRLGCTPEERAFTQEVRLSLAFRFAALPAGALTDSLEETLCYAQVSRILREHCETREFKLIERIGHECFHLIKEYVNSPQTAITVQVHKVRPPIPGLFGGTIFSCGDFTE